MIMYSIKEDKENGQPVLNCFVKAISKTIIKSEEKEETRQTAVMCSPIR